MNLLLAAIGVFGLSTSLVMTFRTRQMLRFRSPGTIRPGSISDWQVRVWRLSAGMMAAMSLTSIYLSLFVF